MPSNLYLSRFRAHNFRSFGSVDLALPAEPGLVLLEGPNGLGKTSWLEAIEWVLSGRVHRWDHQKGEHKFEAVKHVNRRGTGEGTCRVNVEFGPGEHRAGWSGGAETEPAIWLCENPGRWSLGPDNFNGFLRGTHILPQSSSLRLLNLPADERWNQVLRVVSGYSEIDDLSAALQGSKSPLTKVCNEREEGVRQAADASDAWRARVALVRDRRQADVSALLLAPSGAAAALVAEDLPTFALVDSEACARELIAHVRAILESKHLARERIEGQRASLASIVDVPARWDAAEAATIAADGAFATQETLERGLQELVERRLVEEHNATQGFSEAGARVRVARSRTEMLVLLTETVAAIPVARKELAAARERIVSSEENLADTAARRSEIHRQAELRRAYEDRLRAYQDRFAAWRRVQELLAQRDDIVPSGQLLMATASHTATTLLAATSILGERRADTARARQLAENVRKSAGDLQGLVVALARHVDEHTAECPLCLASYREAGALKSLVDEAKERQGPEVARAEDSLKEAIAREAAAAATESEAATAHAQAQRAVALHQTQLGALERVIDDTRTLMPEVTVGQEQSGIAAVGLALDAEHSELVVLPEAEWDPAPVLEQRLKTAIGDVDAAAASRAAANAASEEIAATLATFEARSANLFRQLDVLQDADLSRLLTEAREALGRCEETQREALETLRLAQSEREREQSEAAAAKVQTLSARATRDQRRAELQEIGRSWPLEFPPSSERLGEAGDALATSAKLLNERIASIEATIKRIDRWLEHAALDTEAKELDVDAGGTGVEAWEKEGVRLQGLVDMAKHASLQARDIRDNIESLAASAKAKRDSMRSDLENRLSPILAPMLKSLVVDPTIAGAVIELTEQRSKTNMRAKVDDGGRSTDLLAYASEGQLSGVNLAVQLSMALAFRWCRWPAVLLDDPAQYSDVVHSTNLVETLRVFALHHGFQIFLATHDRDFAMYVESKFRNDGLPATRIMFRQPSDPTMGVVPRIAMRAGGKTGF